MSNFYATPDVYIEETTSHQKSSVSVNTAIPAFVGYTEKAMDGVQSLLNVPTKISSLNEYKYYFGKEAETKFLIKNEGTKYMLYIEREKRFILYHSLILFFANGGTDCYIVSVGNYQDTIEKKSLEKGINKLTEETEPTLIVIPEAVMLTREDCYAVQQKMLIHCGQHVKFRFAILDVYDDSNMYFIQEDICDDELKKHRKGIGNNFLEYGASYYPSIRADIVDFGDIDSKYFYLEEAKKVENYNSNLKVDEGQFETLEHIFSFLVKSLYKNPLFRKDGKFIANDEEISKEDALQQLNSKGHHLNEIMERLMSRSPIKITSKENNLLKRISPVYYNLCKKITEQINILPPSGAIAGVYARSDNQFSVGRTPANFSLEQVLKPTIQVNNKEQEELNRPVDGIAINVVRAFSGKGTMVWGARTMNGNSPLWRYINVKRSMIHLQKSVKAIAEKFVFKPNNEGTWVLIKAEITNFLTDTWRQGILKGGEPEEAFSVEVGEGGKMSSNSILEGFIYITIKVAIVRPMEFIVVRFTQNMLQEN